MEYRPSRSVSNGTIPRPETKNVTFPICFLAAYCQSHGFRRPGEVPASPPAASPRPARHQGIPRMSSSGTKISSFKIHFPVLYCFFPPRQLEQLERLTLDTLSDEDLDLLSDHITFPFEVYLDSPWLHENYTIQVLEFVGRYYGRVPLRRYSKSRMHFSFSLYGFFPVCKQFSLPARDCGQAPSAVLPRRLQGGCQEQRSFRGHQSGDVPLPGLPLLLMHRRRPGGGLLKTRGEPVPHEPAPAGGPEVAGGREEGSPRGRVMYGAAGVGTDLGRGEEGLVLGGPLQEPADRVLPRLPSDAAGGLVQAHEAAQGWTSKSRTMSYFQRFFCICVSNSR